jgi:fluoroacetyl-CoA thioesterase
MGPVPGERAAVRAIVGVADTAEQVGSGDVPVLATPRLLALAEAASVAAIAPHLGSGLTSVGTAVTLEHRRASPVGAELDVEAELTQVEGRRLVFSFIARQLNRSPGDPGDENVVIGAGTVERVIVDRDSFLDRVSGPQQTPGAMSWLPRRFGDPGQPGRSRTGGQTIGQPDLAGMSSARDGGSGAVGRRSDAGG